MDQSTLKAHNEIFLFTAVDSFMIYELDRSQASTDIKCIAKW